MVVSVRAAGGVVWRRQEGREQDDHAVEVLLIHRPRYDDWSFPKGKAEVGESDTRTALREVREETGLACVLGPELITIEYTDALDRPKTVRYWMMTATGEGEWQPNREVDELDWLTVDKARARLSYERELPVLDAFVACL